MGICDSHAIVIHITFFASTLLNQVRTANLTIILFLDENGSPSQPVHNYQYDTMKWVRGRNP